MPDFDADDDQPEKDDEKPVIVVLKKGDLTADEADVLQKNLDSRILRKTSLYEKKNSR
jgi:hypothetical protein